ncbi:MAG: site-specific DNA-methyltransferase [Planctomycetes bacterium]|nr:site-specific DNA-methyltransferase [Planctomycetota bacterium]
MKQLPTACVDLLFADPPFNIGYEYDQYDDHQSAEDYLDWSRKWMPEAVRLLKPNGTLWLAIGDEYAAELKMILQRRCKLICRSWVIWYYTFGQNCKTNFSRSHTHLFYMAKDPKQCTFNVAEIRVPSARQLVYNDDRGNPDGRLPDNTWILRPQDAPESFNPTDDVWHVPRVNGTFRERQGFHGCQMPEQILGRIIRACSNPGDLVLDPFAGSGTTPAVAKKLGRRFIGFELSTDYAARAQRRVATAREGQPLEGSDNPLLPASSHTRQATEADSRQIDLF